LTQRPGRAGEAGCQPESLPSERDRERARRESKIVVDSARPSFSTVISGARSDIGPFRGTGMPVDSGKNLFLIIPVAVTGQPLFGPDCSGPTGRPRTLTSHRPNCKVGRDRGRRARDPATARRRRPGREPESSTHRPGPGHRTSRRRSLRVKPSQAASPPSHAAPTSGRARPGAGRPEL
jgi:hypothetical protein